MSTFASPEAHREWRWHCSAAYGLVTVSILIALTILVFPISPATDTLDSLFRLFLTLGASILGLMLGYLFALDALRTHRDWWLFLLFTPLVAITLAFFIAFSFFATPSSSSSPSLWWDLLSDPRFVIPLIVPPLVSAARWFLYARKQDIPREDAHLETVSDEEPTRRSG